MRQSRQRPPIAENGSAKRGNAVKGPSIAPVYLSIDATDGNLAPRNGEAILDGLGDAVAHNQSQSGLATTTLSQRSTLCPDKSTKLAGILTRT